MADIASTMERVEAASLPDPMEQYKEVSHKVDNAVDYTKTRCLRLGLREVFNHLAK